MLPKLIGKWVIGAANQTFEIQRSYRRKHQFIGVYSRDNLLKVKDWTSVIYLDVYDNTGNHWVATYIKILKQYILMVWALNIFLKKLKFI